MEVSQYVKLSHLTHVFVCEMTHRGLKFFDKTISFSLKNGILDP